MSNHAYTELLNHLRLAPTETLTAMANALEVEPHVCTGQWVNSDGEERPSGCLIVATYAQTPAFDSLVQDCGGVREAFKCLETDLEDGAEDDVYEALNLEYHTANLIIEAYDEWGKDAGERVENKIDGGETYPFKALEKAHQDTLRADILSIVASRG